MKSCSTFPYPNAGILGQARSPEIPERELLRELATMRPGSVTQSCHKVRRRGDRFCSLQTTLDLLARKKARSKTEGEEEKWPGPRHFTSPSPPCTHEAERSQRAVYVYNGEETTVWATSNHTTKPSPSSGAVRMQESEWGSERVRTQARASQGTCVKRLRIPFLQSNRQSSWTNTKAHKSHYKDRAEYSKCSKWHKKKKPQMTSG